MKIPHSILVTSLYALDEQWKNIKSPRKIKKLEIADAVLTHDLQITQDILLTILIALRFWQRKCNNFWKPEIAKAIKFYEKRQRHKN